MPYPMVQSQTFQEFRDRLVTGFQCTYKRLENPLIHTDGTESVVWYLERKIPDNGTIQCTVNIDIDDEHMLPGQIRSICNRLHIDTKEFGFDLG